MEIYDVSELPASLQDILSDEAKKVFIDAYNLAWRSYRADTGYNTVEDSRKTISLRVAWASVKANFEQDENGNWVKKRE